MHKITITEYVIRTYGGLLKHCAIPFHFVCYTDDSTDICKEIEIPEVRAVYNFQAYIESVHSEVYSL